MEFFLEGMTPHNILAIAKSASAYNQEMVSKTAQKFLSANLEYTIAQPEFNNFTVNEVLFVLNARKEQVCSRI